MIKIRRIQRNWREAIKNQRRRKIEQFFQLVKMRLTCEILKAKFRKFTIQVAKIFAATKHLLGTHVPFRIFKSQFHSCEPTCEILRAKFRKFISQLVKIFVAAKHLLSTRMPFRNFKNQFHSGKSSCEPSCEITSNLQKYQPSFKCLFKPMIFSFFISHNHFNLRKNPLSCETQKSQRNLSKRSPKVVRLKRTIPRTSAYLLEHEPLHFSHGQDERSPNPVSISSKHQTESFTCARIHV